MSRGRRSHLTQAALVAAWLALATGVACSRTDDPREHFAAGSQPSRGGASGIGGKDSGASGSTSRSGNASGGQASHGATGGSAATDAGAAAGGAGDGPDWPADFGCGQAPASGGTFTRQALRAAAADCAMWHYCRFEGAATQLEHELAAYADSPSAQALASAQAAYAQAMSMWSIVEPFRFGPGASTTDDKHHGRGLSSLIYVWPEVDRCRIEEQVVLQHYVTKPEGVFTSARGLFALDYLLHYPGADTVCAPSKVATAEWNQLSADDIALRKQQYAAALGTDILTRISDLRAAWAPEHGNFRATFESASGYPNEDEAMTILAWSLLYIERHVKDYKLGVPAGYTATSPVTLQEAAYSGLVTETVRANLRGFRALFQGCGPDGEGLGVDDWLTAAGHGALAHDIVTAWQGAQRAADQHPRFDQASPAELDALYHTVKALTDLLKNDLFGDGSPISLDLPMGLGDDTD